MLSDYIKYLKNNPKGYWFKGKWYGWGWVPVTWQGWLVVLIYVGVVMAPTLLISEEVKNEEQFLVSFFLVIVGATAALLWICIKKGEKPTWRWGKPSNNRKN